MIRSERRQELEQLASSQWGMFTSAQAHALGVGRTQLSRMAAAGTVEPMRRGTYRFTVGEETSHAYVKAAWLSVYPKATAEERLRTRPPDAVVAGATAAALHGIGDLHEEPYTFIVRSRRQTAMEDLVFHQWPLGNGDVTYVDTLPITTMERTVADLVRGRHDEGHIRQVIADALARGADATRIKGMLGGLAASCATVSEGLRVFIDKCSAANAAATVQEILRELDGLAVSDLDPEVIARGRAFVDALLSQSMGLDDTLLSLETVATKRMLGKSS